MNTILCVVDMQYPFLQEEDRPYLHEVVKAIQVARAAGRKILLLEDVCGCPTNEVIREALRDYLNVSLLRKNQWDGSLQIEIELTRARILPERITACGAFAEQCVLATLSGLRERFPMSQLEILLSACVPAPVRTFTKQDWLKYSDRLGLILS